MTDIEFAFELVKSINNDERIRLAYKLGFYHGFRRADSHEKFPSEADLDKASELLVPLKEKHE